MKNGLLGVLASSSLFLSSCQTNHSINQDQQTSSNSYQTKENSEKEEIEINFDTGEIYRITNKDYGDIIELLYDKGKYDHIHNIRYFVEGQCYIWQDPMSAEEKKRMSQPVLEFLRYIDMNKDNILDRKDKNIKT